MPDGAALSGLRCVVGRIRHLCRHPAQARTALLSDTAFVHLSARHHGLTAAGGIDHSRTYHIPEGGHLRNSQALDLAFLGVIPWWQRYRGSFANCSRKDFSATAPSGYLCSPPPRPDRSAGSFRELFRQLFIRSWQRYPALSTPTNGFEGLTEGERRRDLTPCGLTLLLSMFDHAHGPLMVIAVSPLLKAASAMGNRTSALIFCS